MLQKVTGVAIPSFVILNTSHKHGTIFPFLSLKKMNQRVFKSSEQKVSVAQKRLKSRKLTPFYNSGNCFIMCCLVF